MPITALEIAQAVANDLGLPQITTLASAATNTYVRQVLSLMNREGDELYQAHEWTQSQALAVINITTPVTATGDTAAGGDAITNLSPPISTVHANPLVWAVTGNGLVTSTRVTSVQDSLFTIATIDQHATQTQTGATFIFAQDTYTMPADFKWFLNRTMWDRTNQWELIGPISPQTDEWERSGIVTTGPRRRWRQIGVLPTAWRLWPPPTASGSYPATLVFEYESDSWARTASGTALTAMSSDDDYPIIDAQAIVRGAKWRYYQAKGFPYAALQAEYLDYVGRLIARDGGSPDLSLAKPMRSNVLLTTDQVADGYWPGPGNP